MDDGKGPLRLELQHLRVRDQQSSQRIDDLDGFVRENEFWSNPHHMRENYEHDTQSQLNRSLHGIVHDEKTVCCKKKNQGERSTCPNEIASRSKSLNHQLIDARNS